MPMPSSLLPHKSGGLLGWALWTTLGSIAGAAFFFSRWWWFGQPVPWYFWGGELALIGAVTAGLWGIAWAASRARQWSLLRWVQQASQQKGWLWLWGWVVWLSLGLALTPSSFWAGDFHTAVLWQHALLLWFWLLWLSSGAWFVGWKRQGSAFHKPRLVGKRAFVGLLALWSAPALFVLLTGWGWRAPHFWQGVGVPLLSGQVWLVLTLLGVGVTLGRFVPAAYWKPLKARDALVVAALWAVAFGLWWWTTPAPTYFQPAALPPNYQRYPSSDAALYGLGGEQGVSGYGYLATAAMPRGRLANTHLGFVGLLALIHLWAKTAAGVSLGLVLLLALTPALLYLLGAVVHSRGAGLLLAGATILHERNAIAHADLFYATSHVQMWATEPLLREVFVLLALAGVLFLQRPWKRKAWLFAIGALITFGFFVRRENLVLMALSPILVIPFLFKKRQWLRRVGQTAVLLGILGAGMAAVLAPWVLREEALTQHLPYTHQQVSIARLLFFGPVEVVLSPKFRADVFAQSTPAPSPTPRATPSATQAAGHGVGTPPATATANPTPHKAAASPPTATPPSQRHSSPQPTTGLLARLTQWHSGLIVAVGDLFIRNLLALVLAFPPVVRFYPLPLVVKEKTPLWLHTPPSAWHHLPAETTLLLIVEGVVLALGMAVVWRKQKGALLFPVGLMLVYLGVSAVARDAGGRYVVPLDWVLPLFAAVGGFTLLREGAAALGGTLPDWLQSPLTLAEGPRRLARWAWAAGGSVVLLSWAIVALEFGAMGWVAYSGQAGAVSWAGTTPPRWRPVRIDELFIRLNVLHAWDDLPWSRQEVLQALKEHKISAGWGFLFYPRYVAQPEDCKGFCDATQTPPPRFFFDGLLGGVGPLRFHMALASSPPPMPDGSEILVLYCRPASCRGAVFPCTQALALIQVERSNDVPQGKVHVFLPPHPTLQCTPPSPPSQK